MAITAAALTSGTDPTDGTSFATASVTPTSNRLVLLAVWSNRADSINAEAPSSVTGNGLTWVQVATIAYDVAGSSRGTLTLLRALGASPSAGAVTINFSSTHNACSWSLVEFAGIDTSGTNGSAAVVQSATGSSAADADGILVVTLAAFGHVDNATYGAFAATGGGGVYAPGTGFTELHEVGSSGLGTLQTEWRADNDTTVDSDYTTNGADLGGIAVEIKAVSAGISVGTATETDTALALVKTKQKPITLAAETDAAPAIVRLFPPTNTLAPAVTGTVREGSTLTTTDGSWTGSPTFAYQWQRADNVGFTVGVTSVGANQNTFVPTSAEVGRYVRVRVTGTNGAGSAQANSNIVGPVAAIPNFATLPPRVTVETEWDLDPTATSGTEKWRRISHLVREFRIRRGRERSLERTQAGTLSIRLDNSDRRFETGYAGTLVNLITNPSLEIDAVGWAATANATFAREVNAQVGRWRATVTPTAGAAGRGLQILGNAGARIPITPSLKYTFSIMLADGGGFDHPLWLCRIDEYDSGGTLLQQTSGAGVSALAGNRYGARPFVTLPSAHASAASVALFVVTATDSSKLVYLDGAQFELGELSGYVDGDEDNGRWEGTLHASRSFRGGPYYPNVRPMRRIRVITTYGNPIEDSSFETNPVPTPDDPATVATWYQTGGAAVRSNEVAAHSGSYFLKGTKVGASGVGAAVQVTLGSRYRIPVSGGESVVLSAYFRKPSGGATPVSEIQWAAYDDMGGYLIGIEVSGINPPDNAWQRYSTVAYVLPGNASYLEIIAVPITILAADGAVGYIDSIQVELAGVVTNYQQGNGPRILFRGFIQRFPQATTSYRRGEVTLDAVDAMAVLAAGEYTGSPPSELSHVRIGRVLDHIGWPTALRKLDTGSITLVAGTALKTPHLTHCLEVAETEEGVFFVDGPGYAVLHSKTHRTTDTRSTVSQATFGDGVGELPFLPSILPEQDVQNVVNEVKATRTGGAEQTAADATSDDHYFTRSRDYATLHSTDGAALTFAQNVLAKLKEPGLELERLEVEPARDPLLWPVALALEISDRVTVKRRPQGLELLTFTLFVEAVEHQCRIDGERIRWQVGWYLSPV